MGITIDCGPIETGVKHLFGGVVRAVMSPGGSIVASLQNINDFLAVSTPLDDLIHTYFKQEGVVLKVMLHIFEEFVLLLGRHPLNNKVLCMVKENQEKDKNRIKTGQKREACRTREKFKAVAVERGRKTEEKKKEWPKTHTRIKSYASLKKRRKEKGHMCNLKKVATTRT
nr:hypothetical protein [Tanacetum cinerariifolium]